MIARLFSLCRRYHAFGNVRNNSDGSWSYQHGDSERLRSCAIVMRTRRLACAESRWLLQRAPAGDLCTLATAVQVV